MSADNKVIGFLKNHWVYIVGLLVSGILAWNNLKTKVEVHEARLCKIEPQIEFYKECVIEQKSLNKLLKAYLKREGVLVE